jgi:hypothetical protein
MTEVTDAVMEQVATVLDSGGLSFDLDDGAILIGWAGESEDEKIRVKLWCNETAITVNGETHAVPILLVQAPLVVDFELTAEKISWALLASNAFNLASLMKMRVSFPKLDALTIEEAATGEAAGWINMEAEIVASDLDPREIIFVLFALKDAADAIDDLVAGGLGGKTLAQHYRGGSTTGGLTLDI